jgi:Flp pilus assembly pilin Flp
MTTFLKSFQKDESGAVTVDWVVLTAAMVLLGLLIMAAIGGGAKTSAGWVKTTMEGLVTP